MRLAYVVIRYPGYYNIQREIIILTVALRVYLDERGKKGGRRYLGSDHSTTIYRYTDIPTPSRL